MDAGAWVLAGPMQAPPIAGAHFQTVANNCWLMTNISQLVQNTVAFLA